MINNGGIYQLLGLCGEPGSIPAAKIVLGTARGPFMPDLSEVILRSEPWWNDWHKIMVNGPIRWAKPMVRVRGHVGLMWLGGSPLCWSWSSCDHWRWWIAACSPRFFSFIQGWLGHSHRNAHSCGCDATHLGMTAAGWISHRKWQENLLVLYSTSSFSMVEY